MTVPLTLSSISQAQFWGSAGGLFRDRYGDGSAGGVLSVDVSDWNREGVLFGKPAKLCTADEIRDLLAEAALGSSTIRRLVTDATGCILDAGRRHYLASDLQKLVLRLRDQYCRFPGCSRPAERCEVTRAR